MPKLLVVAGILSFLPIWRGAGHCRHNGVTVWQLLYDSTKLEPDSPFGHAHLPYKEAKRRANEAWRVLHGSQNCQVF